MGQKFQVSVYFIARASACLSACSSISISASVAVSLLRCRPRRMFSSPKTIMQISVKCGGNQRNSVS